MSNWDASDEDGASSLSNNRRLTWNNINNTNATTERGTSTTSTYCAQSERDATDAQRVCNVIGMEMHRASFAAEYWTGVFEPFVDGIVDGRMPNPDGTRLGPFFLRM